MNIESTELRKAVVAVVDDDEDMRKSVGAQVAARGFRLVSFASADEFLAWLGRGDAVCDLVISDINMPGASGYDLCRVVRARAPSDRIPIILVTGSDPENEKSTGLIAGADDFIPKPFRSAELFAKVDSLLNIRAADLRKAEKIGRLTHFVSPTVARMLIADAPPALLKPHRADVSVLFVDLRRFTSFAEQAGPEEVLEVLGRYYNTVGDIVVRHAGTLGHLAGDGVMAFFNDPEPVPDHQKVAIRAALEMRAELALLREAWRGRGYDIDFGIGIAEGDATIGGVGFDRFWQYSVIGPVTNLAARLCQAADRGQILVSQRFLGRLEPHPYEACSLGAFQLKGLPQPISVFDVAVLRDPR